MTNERPINISLRGAWARRAAPALSGGLLILSLAVLAWTCGPSAYAAVVHAWGVPPVPATAFSPFLDADMILSGLRCQRMGLDVYVVNPCDALARPFDYSPIWLALSALPVTTAWVVPFGGAMVLAFLLSLLLLPPGRGWAEAAIVAAGVASTATAFAVERGKLRSARLRDRRVRRGPHQGAFQPACPGLRARAAGWWTVSLLAAILSGLAAESEIVRGTPSLRRGLAPSR